MDFKKILGAFVKSGADTGEGTEKPKGAKWSFKGKMKEK